MKILYITTSIHSAAGMERVLSVKANELVRRGYEVTILTYFKSPSNSFFNFDDKIKIRHLNIYDTKGLKRKTYYEKLKYKYIKHNWNKKFKKQVESLVYKEKFDVCVSLCTGYDISFLPKLKDSSLKIAEFHFSFFIYQRTLSNSNGLNRIRVKYLFKSLIKNISRFDKFIVLTKEDSAIWKKYLDNVDVIYNPVTIPVTTPPNYKNKIAIAVGRLTPQKGFDYLIDAWKIVNENYSDWKLYIIGEGELKKELGKQISKNKLNNTITIKPYEKDISNIFAKSSLFVLSSRYEGMPLSLIEAMSFGLPVVSFRCACGPSELIEEGISGYLVKPFDTKELAKSIMKLTGSEIDRIKFGNCAKKKREKLSLDKIMTQWEQLFKLSIEKNVLHHHPVL